MFYVRLCREVWWKLREVVDRAPGGLVVVIWNPFEGGIGVDDGFLVVGVVGCYYSS